MRKAAISFIPTKNGQIYKTKVQNNKEIKQPHPETESGFGTWNNLGRFGDNGGNMCSVQN
ncbi:hypothetical protein [Fluviicola sp.]|jgi:hypothetical protein|uniref:hypothetical protein n=1 Tax=Fluviicola sp. TaxID=1917219 RepID=UPI00282E326B|nr:hypothetical protein [Fluviicola sp.]MDR0802346.1 hypothetical protein [Fluviicola sp.]